MIKPAIPADESRRLQTLRDLQLLDTLPEERFDRVTRLAKQVFSTPIALVSLVDADRQWFKSRQGLDAKLKTAMTMANLIAEQTLSLALSDNLDHKSCYKLTKNAVNQFVQSTCSRLVVH